MIISKDSLNLKDIVKADKKIPVLNNLHMENDGTVIARNTKVLMAVSPVNDFIKEKLNGVLDETPPEEATIPESTIDAVFKSIPNDTEFKGLLEHTDMEVTEHTGTIDELKFLVTDGRNEKTINGKKYDRPYIDYKKNFAEVLDKIVNSKKIVLDITRLILLLTTIKKVCGTGGNELPGFIEFTEDNNIIIRSINPKTGQRVLSVMTAYKGVEGQWLEHDEWESKYKTIKKTKKKKKRKFKLKRKGK